MTNYEKIKFLLDMWVYKGVEVEYVHILWNISKYVYRDIDSLLDCPTYNSWNYTITSITPIPNPPKLLPVGTKVRVFESLFVNIFEDWTENSFNIINVDNDVCAYVIKVWVLNMWLPARAVVPVLD